MFSHAVMSYLHGSYSLSMVCLEYKFRVWCSKDESINEMTKVKFIRTYVPTYRVIGEIYDNNTYTVWAIPNLSYIT